MFPLVVDCARGFAVRPARIFEQKRDCSQSILLRSAILLTAAVGAH